MTPTRNRSLPWAVSGLAFVVTAALLLAAGCSRSKPVPVTPAAPTDGPPSAAQTTSQSGPAASTEAPRSELLESGKLVFDNYCASCHGESGDGNGPAARFLFPKPRNFRDGKFRLVTAVNRIPSDSDLLRVIDRGMPGSAMFPFEHLSEVDRKALVAHVRRLTRAGVEDRIRKLAEDAGDKVDPAELADDVDALTMPARPIEIPVGTSSPDDDSIARGRQLYVKQGCVSCHGETGKGDGVQEQRDDDGWPTSPRDYTRGIFKGGRQREQLYARTMLGMPGSPMPASSNLKPDQIGDLVSYIQSLSDKTTQEKVEHKRTRLVAKRVGELPAQETSEAAWDTAEAARIVVTPLWWRNYEEPALQVQALHDGQSLAVRLTWMDASRNEQAVRPQEFVDMAAVQLFRGPREPFLGMGAANGTVDMWLWQAGQQADPSARADVDTAYPNMAVDLYPFEQSSDGARSHTLLNQPRDFITAWAAGNPRSNPNAGYSGNALQARGFGSLTMLPKVSQVVTATGSWTEGQWTVVLRRPLQVGGDAGVQFAAGDRVAIAFAIWDGAARDRNGQKLVSIWHDLELQR